MLCEEREDLRKSLGLVLVFVGMQLNAAIKEVAFGLDIVELIMIASVALIVDYKNLLKPKPTFPMILAFVMQFVLLIAAMLCRNNTNPTGIKQLITFHLYLLALIYALATNTKHVEFKEFGRILFWVTGFITLVSVFYSLLIIITASASFVTMRCMTLPHGGDPVTMPRAIEMGLISCMMYKKKNFFEKCANVVFVVASMINLITYSNRASMAGCILCFLAWYFVAKDPFTIKAFLKKLALLGFVLLICIVALPQIPTIYAKVIKIRNFVVEGIKTILYIQSNNVDESAQIRNNIMLNVKKDFGDGIILNVLRGLGYNHLYVEKPLLQIFIDTGILGFLVYAYLLIVIPVRYLFKHRKFDNFDNQAEKYVMFFFVQNFIDQILVGLPYHYHLWTPALFVIFTMANQKLRSSENVENRLRI